MFYPDTERASVYKKSISSVHAMFGTWDDSESGKKASLMFRLIPTTFAITAALFAHTLISLNLAFFPDQNF